MTDNQGWVMAAGLGILSTWLLSAFWSGCSLEASAWWCHWPCSSACLFPRLGLLPRLLAFLTEQLTREPGHLLSLAHIYILAYVPMK